VASYFGVQGLAFAVGGVVGSIAGGLLYEVAAAGGWVAITPWLAFLCAGMALALVLRRLGMVTRSSEDATPLATQETSPTRPRSE